LHELTGYFVEAQQAAPVSQQLFTLLAFFWAVAQQALASLQHALPSAQHDAVKQQSSPASQHGAPTRQQSGTVQHAAPSSQQARPNAQQSVLALAEFLAGVAAPDPANITPTDRTTAVTMFFNMEYLQW
jgi:hypothetical protein